MSDFIEIKDEKIDVKEIMGKIKENIERKKREGIYTEKEIREIEEMMPYPLPDIQDIHHFYSQHLYQEKKSAEKEEKTEPASQLNKKSLKKRVKEILLRILNPFAPLIKILVLPVHQEIVQTDENLTRTNEKLEKTIFVVNKTSDYVRLLHNLAHHLVAELTKLKVEKEGMKNKMRILENKIDLLEKRGKVVEKSVFKEK